MAIDPCLIYPDTIFVPTTLLYPSGLCYQPPVPPVIDYGAGGGGHGALMGREFFERYEVAGAWRNVKRVKVPMGGKR